MNQEAYRLAVSDFVFAANNALMPERIKVELVCPKEERVF